MLDLTLLLNFRGMVLKLSKHLNPWFLEEGKGFYYCEDQVTLSCVWAWGTNARLFEEV